MSLRLRASALHFLICVIVAALFLALIWWVFYPAPTFVALRGNEVFLLLVTIDIIVGPLLTFVVFNTKKKYLKFDLAVIAALQVAALVYGISKLYEARPVYIAGLGDKFQVIQATEITEANLAKVNQTLPKFGPVWVGTQMPTKPAEMEDVKMMSEFAGGGLGHFPQHHIPIEQFSEALRTRSKPLSELYQKPGMDRERVENWLRSKGANIETVRFQTVLVAISRFIVFIDGAAGKPIGMYPVELVE
jgi:hypothetical protein